MKSTDFEILRSVEANGRKKIPLTRKPVRLATLINEEKFIKTGGEFIHCETVFLEDKYHDWDWNDGFLTYYSRIAEIADIVVSYVKLEP